MRSGLKLRDLERACVAEGLEVRARAILGGMKTGRARPVIVKSISAVRSRKNAENLIAYIGRLDRHFPRDRTLAADVRDVATKSGLPLADAPVRMFDETGAWVPPDRAMEALRGWNLLTEKEHLTPAARALLESIEGPPAAAWAIVRRLPEKDRLKEVQVRHFVLSAPLSASKEGEAVERLEAAVGATIAETFAAWGHRCFWALHLDGDHPHVHVAVRARSDEGKALRLTRDGALVDGLRAVLARHLRELGFDVSAERRGDRRPLARQVVRGEAVLSEGGSGWRVATTDRGRFVVRDATGPGREIHRLEQRVPAWMRVWGADFLGRALGEPEPDRPGLADSEVSSLLRSCFGPESSKSAAESFRAMWAEDRKLAEWYLVHRPIAFGRPVATFPQASLPALREALSKSDASKVGRRSMRATDPGERYRDLRARAIEAARDRWERSDRTRVISSYQVLARRLEDEHPDETLGRKLATRLRREAVRLEAEAASVPRKDVRRRPEGRVLD